MKNENITGTVCKFGITDSTGKGNMKNLIVGFLMLFIMVSLVYTYDASAKKNIVTNIVVTFRPPAPEEQKTIARKLELTEEQKAEMKVINGKYRQQSMALKNKYNAAYKDVVLLMKEDKPNKERVNRELKTFHNIHSQVVDVEVQYWMDLKTILTPAQNNKLWEIFEKGRIRK
ncbi:MAG TPA: hypothetical protein ENG83_05310 [Nitrospirae bacterium]|nr:hypothetical protein BMS3Abin06_00842 [bacterium BMS3Abin06]HDH04988.1 hypothetical protein [Nitrospirota bacterium]HDH11604.1 hypothetical protein [Nitrospirota bacterium]HDZ02024.1 hypothetical protein [Nitrospirota bacterium]